MDTLKIEFTNTQLDALIYAINKQSTGLSSGEVALFAALIGAIAAIGGQLIIFCLTRSKEKKNHKIELISNERRLAFLLTEHYKELVMHKVHKEYWYRLSNNSTGKDRKDSHERHFKSSKLSFETLNKIRTELSEYFKVIISFTTITGKNTNIDQEIKSIQDFEPKKIDQNKNYKTYNEIREAAKEDEKELNENYLHYSKCFTKINKEMNKKV